MTLEKHGRPRATVEDWLVMHDVARVTNGLFPFPRIRPIRRNCRARTRADIAPGRLGRIVPPMSSDPTIRLPSAIPYFLPQLKKVLLRRSVGKPAEAGSSF
jgi:hypothetical protein